MPNGGITPDCVHCVHYRGTPYTGGDSTCTHHAVPLPIPIRAFCTSYAVREAYHHELLLDDKLDRTRLDPALMYVWLGGYDIPFTFEPLTTISAYGTWTRDQFHEALATLTQRHIQDTDTGPQPD